jgi:hypothetical protein
VALAIDRTAIVEEAFLGHARPILGAPIRMETDAPLGPIG